MLGLFSWTVIMSGEKMQSSVCSSAWKWTIGAAVSVSAAWMIGKRWWSKKKLDQKLAKKQGLCRETFKQIEQQLNENRLPGTERDAILSLSLSALQAKLQSGELKSVDVLRAYQEKALEVNARINCITEAIPEAQEQAERCDGEGDRKRLLHGVPLSVKENIGVQGYDRTGGLQVNIGIPCKEDSVVVEVFKRHGAIPFVRTNVPQGMLSFGCSNSIFGRTVNPHNTARCPGGSSGGEGAILGGGGSIVGLGTDVGGSVRVPAGFCGVCGLKPTLGRFSKEGVYTVTKGRMLIAGVVGPMARDVDSLIVMTRVLASPDMLELDPALPPLPFQDQLLNSTHRLKIGYFLWDGNLRPVPAVCRAVREAKAALQSLGHTLVEFSPPDFAEMFPKLYVASMVGADQGQMLRNAVKDDYLDTGLRRIVTLSKLPRWLIYLMAQIIKNKDPLKSKTLPCLKSDGTAYSWFNLAEEILSYRRRFVAEWTNLGLDAVICPVFCSPAPKSEIISMVTEGASSCTLFNLINFPAGVVPVSKVTAQDVGDVNNATLYRPRTRSEELLKKSCDTKESIGLPLAVQCVTLPFKEELCLRVMKELETTLSYSSL